MSVWQPSASIATLQRRAALFRQIREFFHARQVLEVDTPVMSQCAVSDPFIDSIEVGYRAHVGDAISLLYLQTSPEYAMKRLLAAGSGAIYQMGKVFRNGEYGQRHNPEFTMLEWYRPGFDEQQLMAEVEALVKLVLPEQVIERITYAQLFQRYLGFCPHRAPLAQLIASTQQHIDITLDDEDRDTWLNLLMSHVIEPQFKPGSALFVTDYPASQAALAKIKTDAQGRKVAARFELFIDGVELANGYHELTDANEQRQRLLADQQQRLALDLPQRPLDMRLVEALAEGMPECAGVALGVDRLLMLAAEKEQIAEVIPFAHERA